MWRSWGQKCLWLISLVIPFLLCFSKAAVKGAKQVRSEEFNMTSFSDGSLWWGWLYQRLEHGASWWRTHTVLGCLLWSDWVKARSLAFPHRGFSAEAWSVSASLSRKKKGELGLVSARPTKVLGLSLSQDERSQCRGRSPVLQAMLSWHHPSSSLVVTRDYWGWWQVGRVLTGLCAHQIGDERPISIISSSFLLFSQDTQFCCSETDAESASRARHGTQAFNKRPQSPLWPQHGQRSHCCLCQIWPNFWWTDFQNGLVLIIYTY